MGMKRLLPILFELSALSTATLQHEQQLFSHSVKDINVPDITAHIGVKRDIPVWPTDTYPSGVDDGHGGVKTLNPKKPKKPKHTHRRRRDALSSSDDDDDDDPIKSSIKSSISSKTDEIISKAWDWVKPREVEPISTVDSDSSLSKRDWPTEYPFPTHLLPPGVVHSMTSRYDEEVDKRDAVSTINLGSLHATRVLPPLWVKPDTEFVPELPTSFSTEEYIYPTRYPGAPKRPAVTPAPTMSYIAVGNDQDVKEATDEAEKSYLQGQFATAVVIGDVTHVIKPTLEVIVEGPASRNDLSIGTYYSTHYVTLRDGSHLIRTYHPVSVTTTTATVSVPDSESTSTSVGATTVVVTAATTEVVTVSAEPASTSTETILTTVSVDARKRDVNLEQGQAGVHMAMEGPALVPTYLITAASYRVPPISPSLHLQVAPATDGQARYTTSNGEILLRIPMVTTTETATMTEPSFPIGTITRTVTETVTYEAHTTMSYTGKADTVTSMITKIRVIPFPWGRYPSATVSYSSSITRGVKIPKLSANAAVGRRPPFKLRPSFWCGTPDGLVPPLSEDHPFVDKPVYPHITAQGKATPIGELTNPQPTMESTFSMIGSSIARFEPPTTTNKDAAVPTGSFEEDEMICKVGPEGLVCEKVDAKSPPKKGPVLAPGIGKAKPPADWSVTVRCYVDVQGKHHCRKVVHVPIPKGERSAVSSHDQPKQESFVTIPKHHDERDTASNITAIKASASAFDSTGSFTCRDPMVLPEAQHVMAGVKHLESLNTMITVPACKPSIHGGMSCKRHDPYKNEKGDDSGCASQRVSCSHETGTYAINCGLNSDFQLRPKEIAGIVRELLSDCCLNEKGTDKCVEWNKDRNKKWGPMKAGGLWKAKDHEWYIDVRRTEGKGDDC